MGTRAMIACGVFVVIACANSDAAADGILETTPGGGTAMPPPPPPPRSSEDAWFSVGGRAGLGGVILKPSPSTTGAAILEGITVGSILLHPGISLNVGISTAKDGIRLRLGAEAGSWGVLIGGLGVGGNLMLGWGHADKYGVGIGIGYEWLLVPFFTQHYRHSFRSGLRFIPTRTGSSETTLGVDVTIAMPASNDTGSFVSFDGTLYTQTLWGLAFSGEIATLW